MSVFDSIKLSVPVVTVSDITIPVDYNDGTAVDPPAGTVFWSQKQVDDFLNDQSASNFKHLELVYAALPIIILHNIIIQLAAGVHRPSPTPLNDAYSIFLAGKTTVGIGSVKIVGTPPSSWEVISGLSGLIIDSHTGTGDPSLYVGTSNPNAFAGLDLRGYYAVLSTGQATPIINNDDNTLYTVATQSPAVTDGIDTVTVARPSTIIRNSLDDTTSFMTGFILTVGGGAADVYAGISFEDITLESFACVTMFDFGNILITCTRVLFDHITYTQPPYNITANGHGILPFELSRAQFDTCSFRSASGNGVDGSFGPGVNSDSFFMFVIACFFMGGDRDDGFRIAGGATVRLYGTVFVDHPVYVRECAEIDFADTDYYGRYCEIRDVAAGYPGLVFERRGHALQLSEGNIYHRIIFKNNTGPCVRLHNGQIDVSSTWLDGGGNLDVGIELVGPFSEMSLSLATNVSGSIGDVRDADGSILSYTTIQATGPLTAGLNFIEKA